MTILIDGKPAAVKEGTNIEYTSDNRLFHEREDYTMNIELPLNQKENALIFGNVNRKDVEVDKIYFDAEILADGWRRRGAVVVTSITDNMAKVQFIGGRSYQNFYPKFDKTYIDELDLGDIPVWLPDNYQETSGGRNRNDRVGTAGPRGGGGGSGEKVTKTTADAWGDGDVIALPWVNASSGNIQNRADFVEKNGEYQFVWHVKEDDEEDTEIVRALSVQARLYYLTELICQALGYELHAESWRSSDYYHLYSFNSLPGAWGGMSWQDTLPHWSINEYFTHLERLMLCALDINHKDKTISFSWSNENIVNAGTVAIDSIIDEYTLSVTKEDDSQYSAMKNIGYADGGHNMANIYSCDWLFRKQKVGAEEFDTLAEFMTYLNGRDKTWFRGGAIESIYYVREVDNYFILYVKGRYFVDRKQVAEIMKYANAYEVLPLNAFGARIFDEENWEDHEDIGIMPVWIDETDRGWIPFFEAGDLDNQATCGEQYKHRFAGWDPANDEGEIEPDQILQSYRFRKIKEGDNSDRTKYSNLQVGFWFGSVIQENRLPRPYTDGYIIINDVDFRDTWGGEDTLYQHYYVREVGNCSLRLNSDQYGQGQMLSKAVKIESQRKYEFSFLMDGMPNVMATFVIRGKKYLCSTIKCEITEYGMSRLKKGTFYRISE